MRAASSNLPLIICLRIAVEETIFLPTLTMGTTLTSKPYSRPSFLSESAFPDLPFPKTKLLPIKTFEALNLPARTFPAKSLGVNLENFLSNLTTQHLSAPRPQISFKRWEVDIIEGTFICGLRIFEGWGSKVITTLSSFLFLASRIAALMILRWPIWTPKYTYSQDRILHILIS